MTIEEKGMHHFPLPTLLLIQDKMILHKQVFRNTSFRQKVYEELETYACIHLLVT